MRRLLWISHINGIARSNHMLVCHEEIGGNEEASSRKCCLLRRRLCFSHCLSMLASTIHDCFGWHSYCLSCREKPTIYFFFSLKITNVFASAILFMNSIDTSGE